MNRRFAFTAACTLALSVLAGVAATADPARPWVAVSGGFHTYDMSEVNDGLRSLEALFPDVNRIHSGFGLGGSAGVDLSAVSLSLGYERLSASAEMIEDLRFDVPADVVFGRVAYRTGTIGRFQPSVAIGAGAAIAKGTWGFADVAIPALAAERRLRGAGQAEIYGPILDVSGTAPYLEGTLQAATAIGYRWARVDAAAEGSEGAGELTIDYSGLASRLSLRYAFR